MKKSLALFLCMASIASVALAGPLRHSASETIEVGGVKITVPIPDGYCVPDGMMAEMTKKIADMDKYNATHLTIMKCDEDGSLSPEPDYFILKTPMTMLTMDVNKPGLIASMGAAFANPAFGKMMNGEAMNNEMSSAMSEGFGTKMDFNGETRPLGKDSDCAYIGGVMEMSTEAMSRKLATAICVTAVGKRTVTINWYGTDTTNEGVVALAKKARAIALAMK